MTTQNRKKPSKKRKKVWRKAQGQAPRSTRKGTKLTFTSSTSPEIRTKQRKARRPSKVTVRYECPLCGGPHKRTNTMRPLKS